MCRATARTAGPPPALLRGTVLARGGHRRIKGASVFVDGVPVAETDDEGRFSVTAAPGRHRLQAIASRYQAADVTVDLPPAGWTGEVRLAAGGQAFETVVAAKPVTPVVRIDAEAARTTPGTGGDPFRVIESLPGVSQIVWPFALYAIRGANPGNTGFFLDGMRVPALFHFALGPSIIHPYLIDKLSFYPGGYPARLGGYVSGAVAADTAAPPNDIARFTADLRLYDAGALVTTPWDGGRGTVAVAARYAYTGLIVSRLFGDVDFGYADYQLRADHTFAGGRATLLALGSFDHLDIKDQSIGDASLNFHRLDLRWERPVAGWQMLARTAFGTDDAKSQLYSNPIARARLRRLAADLVPAHAARFGVRDRRRGRGAALQHRPRLRDGPAVHGPDAGRAGAAGRSGADARRAVAARVRRGGDPARAAEAGAGPALRRVLRAGRRARRVRAPAGGAAARSRPRSASTPPSAASRRCPACPSASPASRRSASRDLGLQTSTQAALGVESRLPADLSLRLTGFYQWLYVSDMRSTFDHDVTAPEFLEMRHGRGYGAELMLRLPERARVSGWLAYTLSWSLREFDGVFAPSDWDQRHILNLVDDGPLEGRLLRRRALPLQHRASLSGQARRIRAAAGVLADRSARGQAVRPRPQHVGLLPRARKRDVQPAGDRAARRSTTRTRREPVGFRIVLPSIGVHVEW